MSNRDGDDLAERRRERIIEQARQSMVRTTGVEGARRILAKGAARLIKQGYARGVPGLCPAPEEGRSACRRVVAEGEGLCPKHLAEAERIERRLAAAERREAREAARSAAEARRKADARQDLGRGRSGPPEAGEGDDRAAGPQRAVPAVHRAVHWPELEEEALSASGAGGE